MHPFQLAILAMALTDTEWRRDDSRQGRRVLTTAELDALADWGWHGPGLMGVLAVCANAVRWRWRPRASNRLAPTPLPTSEATAQV